MKKNKLFLALLATAVTIPVIATSVPVNVEAAGKVFKDVPKSNAYYEIIHEMSNQKIINGYTDGNFRPNEVISRKHAAVLLSRAKGSNLPQATKFVQFKDIPEKYVYFDDIKKLQQAGIFTADAKGNFNPNQALTRAEMAKVLVVAFDLKIKADYDFPDVPTSHTASKYVRALYSNGITTGNNGKFLPNDPLTRAHYAVFMHRAMNIDDNFVAKPIVKTTPTPEPKPDPIIRPKIDISGIVLYEDVPRPPGYELQKQKDMQEKAYAEIQAKNGHNYMGGFAIRDRTYLLNGGSLELILEARSNDFGISYEELVKLINQVVRTGEVYDGGNFSLYYDYEGKGIRTSGISY